MMRIEGKPSATSKSAQADDEFEEVRQSFLSRLHGEQARLLVLTGALESANENPASVLGDLEVFAHRLRGAAAVFDARVLSEDAKSLELAAAAAAIEPVIDNDPLVWAAIRTLISRLDSMNGNPHPASCAASRHPN